jgi:plasmid maintenance system antidote protein VapI
MPKEMKNYTMMTDALREAIEQSELSYKRLEAETGVIRQSLMRFARGEQSLRLDMADKLANYFGLEVRKRKVK